MDFDTMIRQDAVKGMERLIGVVNQLKTNQPYKVVNVTGVTSNPPTDAEISGLLDTPTRVGENVIGLIKDTTNSRYWLVFGDGSNWYYVAYGLAV